MSIHDLVRTCFDFGLDGRQTDFCVKSAVGSLIKANLPFIHIRMNSLDELYTMLRTADGMHVLIEGDRFIINAFYKFDEKLPTSRIYFMKTEGLFEFSKMGLSLEKKGIKLLPVNSKQFSKLIEEDSYAKRYQDWSQDWNQKTRDFKELLDGRIDNTVIEEGTLLYSDGCLICGKEPTFFCTSTTFAANTMFGLKLCLEHHVESAETKPLFAYIANKLNTTDHFRSQVNEAFAGAKEFDQGEMIEAGRHILQEELKCTIRKIEDNTLTADRRSGIRIVLRLDAPWDYAYIILSPNGKEISRIDSASHHALKFGPAHVHPNLSKNKKKRKPVEPSFTYGFPSADLKAIKKLIERAEARLTLRE